MRPLARASTERPSTSRTSRTASCSTSRPTEERATPPEAGGARPRASCGCCATTTPSRSTPTSTPTATSPPRASCPATRFPRLPLAAYIPAAQRRDARRRRRLPAAAAVPRDQRVRPGRADLPRGRPLRGQPRPAPDAAAGGIGAVDTEDARRCEACGYHHVRRAGLDVCEHCGAALGAPAIRPAAAADRLHPAPRADLQRRGGAPASRLRARDVLPLRRARSPHRAARRAVRPDGRRDSSSTLSYGDAATVRDRQRRAPPAQGSRRPRLLARHRQGAMARGHGKPKTPPPRTMRWTTPADAPYEAEGHPVRRGQPQHPRRPAHRRGPATRPRPACATPSNVASRPTFQLEDSELASERTARRRRDAAGCSSPRPPRAAPACCAGCSPNRTPWPGRPQGAARSPTSTPTPASDLGTRRRSARALRAGLLRLPAVLQQPDSTTSRSTGTRSATCCCELGRGATVVSGAGGEARPASRSTAARAHVDSRRWSATSSTCSPSAATALPDGAQRARRSRGGPAGLRLPTPDGAVGGLRRRPDHDRPRIAERDARAEERLHRRRLDGGAVPARRRLGDARLDSDASDVFGEGTGSDA